LEKEITPILIRLAMETTSEPDPVTVPEAVEEEEDGPLTSLSLSLPGVDFVMPISPSSMSVCNSESGKSF